MQTRENYVYAGNGVYIERKQELDRSIFYWLLRRPIKAIKYFLCYKPIGDLSLKKHGVSCVLPFHLHMRNLNNNGGNFRFILYLLLSPLYFLVMLPVEFQLWKAYKKERYFVTSLWTFIFIRSLSIGNPIEKPNK